MFYYMCVTVNVITKLFYLCWCKILAILEQYNLWLKGNYKTMPNEHVLFF